MLFLLYLNPHLHRMTTKTLQRLVGAITTLKMVLRKEKEGSMRELLEDTLRELREELKSHKEHTGESPIPVHQDD